MKFLSFIFPETTKKQIDSMPAEMRLKFYEAVTDYGMYGIEPVGLTDIETVIWIPMKDLIDSCAERRGAPAGNSNASRKNNSNNSETDENKKNKKNNSENSETNEIIESSLSNSNGNGNDNDNGNAKESGVSGETQRFSDENPASSHEKPKEPHEKKARFCKPTVDEIAEYCKERGNGIDARSFFDFYESKGWVIGKARMRDWRACVRTWEQRKRNEDTGGRGRAGAMWGKENEVSEEYLETIT